MVNPIVAAVRGHKIHPLTLSVQSPWGGGKSTVLKLIEAEFEDVETCFVVPTNPWAYDDQDDVKGTLISEILHGIQAWAAAPPFLKVLNLDPYISLAASLINVRMGAQVSDDVLALINDLLGESEAARNVAADTLCERGQDEQLAALEVLIGATKRTDDAETVIRGAVLWVGKNPALEDATATGVEAHCWGARLTPGAIVELANSRRPALVALVQRAAQDASLHPSTQETARDELEQLDGN